jgi:hypothetical protein
MKEIDYKLLFLEGLAEPDYSRVEFWAKQQPESGYSKGVFWMKLNEWFNHYNQKIKLDIESQLVQGNNVLDCAYSLLIETNGKLVGHIGKNELTSLGLSLHLLGKEWKLSKEESKYSHREKALAHLLRVECREAQPIPRKEQKPKKFELAFDSLNPKTKSKDSPYREPTKKELESVISILQDSPKALKEAKARLQKLVKSNE